MQVSPVCTYRIQLHQGFRFEDATAIIPYLGELGISHVYCSPYLQAAPGSTHGYDVVDHSHVNQELGGHIARDTFSHTLKQSGMSHILDVVPNHMAIKAPENPWWWDVLENGPSSRYATFFDVDWEPYETRLSNMVIAPILGNHYGRILTAGELLLKYDSGTFTIHYFDHVFPVAPRSLGNLLEKAASRCGSDHLAFIAWAYSSMPLPTLTDRSSLNRRHRDKEVLRQQLAELCREQPFVASAIAETVSEVNGDIEALDILIGQQNYRLTFWRLAERDLGYRRFFDINTLAALRMEDEQVFSETHNLIFNWMQDSSIDGLRIDHPDGLRDPETYFRRLRLIRSDIWILVEKILQRGESLPENWKVDGTTGYDFLNRVNGLFIDPAGEETLTRFYEEFTAEKDSYEALVWQKKHQVIQEILGSDVNYLTSLLIEVCEHNRDYRDYTRHDLRQGLSELAASFPVYRTYIQAESEQICEQDIHFITQAAEKAKTNQPEMEAELIDFLRDILLLRIQGEAETEFVMRFQQFTGPVMAKGLEDTLFYSYNRFISLNEVGGEPNRFGFDPQAFHQSCQEIQLKWPSTMLASSTHDTKRSEDVRARLNLLSEMPDKWTAVVKSWGEINAKYCTNDWPDRNTEYLLYQTMVGAWPVEEKRIQQYMEKVTREAKLYTSWTHQNTEYEQAVRKFVSGIMRDRDFLISFKDFVFPLIHPGRINSLAQLLLKLTAPGIPDIYQGNEIWNLSLVDPDNRRPVDYSLRKRLLDSVKDMTPEEVMDGMEAGLPKMWVIRNTLRLRKQRPEWFGAEAEYVPITAEGKLAKHIIAFSRANKIITVVPRLFLSRKTWGHTVIQIPRGTWTNEFAPGTISGGEVRVGELFKKFPVCLLTRMEAENDHF